MGDKSKIEWTDATWNPIVGCSKVSEGCRNCYAMSTAFRVEHCGVAHYAGLTRPGSNGAQWTGEVRAAPDQIWMQPLHWRRGRRIFVNSMGDVFHEKVPNKWIDRLFAVMALAPQHHFIILTKRAKLLQAYMIDDAGRLARWGKFPTAEWPLPNVTLGVSVEDQATADDRLPHLLAAPAATRIVSAEPLLGAIVLAGGWFGLGDNGAFGTGRLDGVIVGGESGPHARPMHPDWARSLRDQCAAAGVPFFLKQWGEWAPICAIDADALDGALYHPAPARYPEASRRPRVPTMVMHATGEEFGGLEPRAFAVGTGAMTMFKIGKKRAGRLLDGRVYDELPA